MAKKAKVGHGKVSQQQNHLGDYSQALNKSIALGNRIWVSWERKSRFVVVTFIIYSH